MGPSYSAAPNLSQENTTFVSLPCTWSLVHSPLPIVASPRTSLPGLRNLLHSLDSRHPLKVQFASMAERQWTLSRHSVAVLHPHTCGLKNGSRPRIRGQELPCHNGLVISCYPLRCDQTASETLATNSEASSAGTRFRR